MLLPILTNIVGVKAPVPILTIAQLIGNASRAWFGRTEIRWRPVAYFVVTAIPASIAGSLLFTGLPARPITMGIGALLLVIVALRRLGVTRFNFGECGLLAGGALTGFLSGLAGSVGPLGAAFFWTDKKIIERLPRERFVLLVEVLLVVSAAQLILLA